MFTAIAPWSRETKTTFYRHTIHTLIFTALDGKERWTAYRFVRNVYDYHWSVRLTDVIFDLSQSASFSQYTHQSSQQSNAESMLGEEDSQSSFPASQEIMPATSLTQTNEPVFKKPKNQRAGGQWCWRARSICPRILKQTKKSVYSAPLHDSLLSFMRSDVAYHQIDNYHWA